MDTLQLFIFSLSKWNIPGTSYMISTWGEFRIPPVVESKYLPVALEAGLRDRRLLSGGVSLGR